MTQRINNLVYYVFSLWLCIRGASSRDPIYSDHIMFSALGLIGLLQMRLKEVIFTKKNMLEWLKISNLLFFSLNFMSRVSSGVGMEEWLFFLVILIMEFL